MDTLFQTSSMNKICRPKMFPSVINKFARSWNILEPQTLFKVGGNFLEMPLFFGRGVRECTSNQVAAQGADQSYFRITANCLPCLVCFLFNIEEAFHKFQTTLCIVLTQTGRVFRVNSIFCMGKERKVLPRKYLFGYRRTHFRSSYKIFQ